MQLQDIMESLTMKGLNPSNFVPKLVSVGPLD